MIILKIWYIITHSKIKMTITFLLQSCEKKLKYLLFNWKKKKKKELHSYAKRIVSLNLFSNLRAFPIFKKDIRLKNKSNNYTRD